MSGPADGARSCGWCEGPIARRARRDAVCCSKRCRQARHRFLRATADAGALACSASAPGGVACGRPRRLAYADPPYPGLARLYRDHPDYDGEVDHAALLARLAGYDAWALSTSARALPDVLRMCPAGVRVAAWHRGERPHQRARYPLNAWEPVVYLPALTVPGTEGRRRVDSLVHGVAPMTTLPGRVIGAKPAAFCAWMFGLLGARPGDHLDDLFPGSRAVTRAWAAFTGEPTAPTAPARSAAVSPHGVAQDRHDGSPPAPDDASSPSPSNASPKALSDTSSFPSLSDVSSPSPSDASLLAGRDTSPHPPADTTPAGDRPTCMERT